jgi:hypothetical protein
VTVKALKSGIVIDVWESVDQAAFSYAVPDQADQVEATSDDVTRRVSLSGYPTDLGLLEPTRGVTKKEMQTIDFEGVTSRGMRKIPSGYAGLNWFNLNAIARDFTKRGQGYVNGNTSGDYVAYTSSGYPALIYSDQPFDFIGVYLSVAWLKAEGEVGTIEAWRGDELIAKDNIALSALSPVHYNPCLPDVTRIRLTTKHYWQMVIDDLVIAR